MKSIVIKITLLSFFGFLVVLFPALVHAGYFYVEQTGDDMIVANDGYSQYIIEYNYECYSSDFLEGDTIYIDSNYTPLFGDTIVTSGYFEKTCEVTDAEEVNLKKYYVENVLDSDDKIIVTDKLGDSYLVEYGLGCGLGMWRYEGKNIDIDIGGSFLDGIGDRIYLIDRSDDCKVWDAEELSGNYSGGSSSYAPSTDTDALEELLKSSCPANSSYTGSGCTCNSGYVANANGDACVTITQSCQSKYGINSYGSGTSCYCAQGYEWNTAQTSCVPSITCPDNSTKVGGSCICNDGFVMKSGQCISYTADCKLIYGENVIGTKGPNNNSLCDCANGYVWNSEQTSCIKKVVAPPPAPTQAEFSKPIVKEQSPSVEKTVEQNEIVEDTSAETDVQIQEEVAVSGEDKTQDTSEKEGILKRIWNWFISLFRF